MGVPRELARRSVTARVAARLTKQHLEALPPCADDRPALLLPVRLEAGVVGGELRVRVHLDDLHHQPGAALPRPGLLPDRFAFYLYDAAGQPAHPPVRGRLIHEETIPPEDFDGAVAAGLAVSIPLAAVAVAVGSGRLARIVVAGLARRDARAAQTSVEQLVAPGSERLARALGVTHRPEAAREMINAGDAAHDRAGDMNAALWPATGGYFLRHMLAGKVPARDITALGDHVARFVRAGGPLPPLRAGARAYGVVPVSRLARRSQENPGGWEASPRDLPSTPALDDALHRTLIMLAARWSSRALNPALTPRVGVDGGQQELLGVLSMQPVSTTVHARPMVDPRFLGWADAALRDRLFDCHCAPEDDLPAEGTPAEKIADWAATCRSERAQYPLLMGAITGADRAWFTGVPVARAYCWWNAEPVSTATLRQDLLARSLAAGAGEGGRRARDAVSRLVASPMLEFFNRVGAAEEIVKKIQDDPRVGLGPPHAYGIRLAVARKILEARDALPGRRFTAPEQIDAVKMVGADTFHDIQYTFEPETAFDLDLLFRQTLDLFTHRLDAWLTSLAGKRLASMRAAQPHGVHVGAYGTVEEVDLSAPPTAQAESPRCLLLAVPAARGATPGCWSEDQVAAIVADTIDLARMRVVDLDALAALPGDALGPLVPSLFLPAAPDHPMWARETVARSLDRWLTRLLVLDRTFDFQELTRWTDHRQVPAAPGAGDLVFTSTGDDLLTVGDCRPTSGAHRVSRGVLLAQSGLRIRLLDPRPALRLEIDAAGAAQLRAFDTAGAPLEVHATVEEALGAVTVFSDAFTHRAVTISQVLVSAPDGDLAVLELGKAAVLQAVRTYRQPRDSDAPVAGVPPSFHGQFAAWLRLEPHARSADPAVPPVDAAADPLWTLARQWQMGALRLG